LDVRDWLYVEDHIVALLAVCENGQAGGCYNIGGHNVMDLRLQEVIERIGQGHPRLVSGDPRLLLNHPEFWHDIARTGAPLKNEGIAVCSIDRDRLRYSDEVAPFTAAGGTPITPSASIIVYVTVFAKQS